MAISAIRTEGGLIPREILERVAAEDASLPGMEQQAYHLPANERLGEAVNRSWNRLMGLWEAYSAALKGRGEKDPATGLTRDRWLLPLFDELGYGRLQRTSAVEIEGKSFAISHAWYRTPIHLVGAGLSIDRRAAGIAGAAAAAPHSLVQEFLNRSDDHLWAFVSNGRLLRILRDNHSLSRQAYVEFDLEAIMQGELFSDFRVLWLVCHQSRLEAEEPDECLLEAWFRLAREEGVRALDSLRDGVERAIEAFGSGFLRHPANGRLHDGLRSGALDRQDYYRELLRLVYRLIFLFVAEDREVLADPAASVDARHRYRRYFASNRLRELAGRRRGTSHDDMWRGFQVVLSRLGEGSPDLGLPALGSFLWSAEAVEWIGDAKLRNDDLLAALRALCYTTENQQLLLVNWRTLGSEELGSVYESLLELHPQMNREAGTFELSTAAGHERKKTGSYYTPTSLVDSLLDSALEPVLETAMRSADPEAALLELKVCDTAAGSGHFLVGAARRIALRLASVRTGDEEASPEAVSRALRDVVGRCIYGVDLNPLAVELCKVSLWMEALEPGKPLSFLDHHIQLGNSLLGTTPHLLREGIPDDAFKEIEGDDRKVVRDLRKRNREERKSEQIGFHAQMVAEPDTRYGEIESLLDDLNRADDSNLEAVRQKEARYRRLLDDPRYRTERLVADTWCAAFVWRKDGKAVPAITEDVFRHIQRQPDEATDAVVTEVHWLADRYRFFHFHLAFPDIFRADSRIAERGDVTGWSGGFDVVLGNPPWEHTELKEKEWFAEQDPQIANAAGAHRKRLIAALETEDPALFEAFTAARREAEAVSHFARNSGRFPFCGRGRINTYALFAEGNLQIVGPKGRMGNIVPAGIATDATTQFFFRDIVERSSLSSLYHFENEAKIFPDVHNAFRFCLITIAGRATRLEFTPFVAYARSVSDLSDPSRMYVLTPKDIVLMNPNTATIPVFRRRIDAEITKKIYRAVPVLIRESAPDGNPWGLSFKQGLFNMSSDSAVFRSKDDLQSAGWQFVGNCFEQGGRRYLPLFEAKMLHQFDHRFGTYAGQTEAQANKGVLPHVQYSDHADPAFRTVPRYWVPEADVLERLPAEWNREWLMAWRDITGSENSRTVISAILPIAGVGHTAPLFFPSAEAVACVPGLLANLNCYVLDYVARHKIGGKHLTYTVLYQLPVLPPSRYEEPTPWEPSVCLGDWVRPRVIELTYTSTDLCAFGREYGAADQAYKWLPRRRVSIEMELNAAYFQLYGLSRREIEHILETFPVVKQDEIKRHGEFRTKRMILEVYDEMVRAVRTDGPYKTSLEPPPADARAAHPQGVKGEGL